MTAPFVGMSVRRESTESASPSYARMSVVGIAGPFAKAATAAQPAFDAAFPLDTPVRFQSSDATARLIDPDGDVGRFISLTAAQLGRLQQGFECVIVRTALGGTVDATIAGIAGNAANRTGIHAFRRAGAVCGVYPRLIGIPGGYATIADVGETNAIVAQLPALLAGIMAISAVQAPGTSEADDRAFRETIASERIMVVTPGVKTEKSDGTQAITDAAAIALGLFVRRDFESDGRPFKGIMNQPVYGITATTRPIEFSWVDGSVEGQVLLSEQMGPVVRGESGDDFAVADGGHVFLGFEGTGAESIWRQIHKVRGRDFVELTAIRTFREYFGRFGLTRQTIDSIVDTVEDILIVAEGKQEILGFDVRFDPNENNASDLRQGHIYIDMKFEEVPLFTKATLISRPYKKAIQDLIDQLTNNVDTSV